MLGAAKTRLTFAALAALATLAVLAAFAGPARAASLALDAPDGCVDLATLNQEVADLVGRPLADSPDADFRVTITPARGGRWHLQLEATNGPAAGPHGGPRAVRELDGANCSELAEAAAVAIAVSVRALADTTSAPASSPLPGVAVAAAPAAATIGSAAAPPGPTWRPGLTLAMAGDSGELPGVGVGVLGGALVERGSVRLALTVGWFPAREHPVTNGGGRFQLVFAAADGCFAPGRGRWKLLACGGVEAGAYGATGENVQRPSAQTTFWRAGRGRLGAAVGLTDTIAFAVNGTAVIPLARPTFVLDGGMLAVYRPAAVGVRLDAGLEVLF